MERRRNTRRKQAVVSAVKAVQGPFTAEQLFQLAQQFLPGISRSTVYRTICILRNEGSIREVCLPHGERLFSHTDADVLCVLECEECGRFISIPAAGLSSQVASVARERHFSAVQSTIYVRGQCQDWLGKGPCPRWTNLGWESKAGRRGKGPGWQAKAKATG
jgi:Fur family transcriptional regulator, ferric uptake regulator